MSVHPRSVLTPTKHPLILQLDAAGNPCRWIDYERAIYYYSKDLVAWTLGDNGYRIIGGKSRVTGERSFMDLNTIIAVKGKVAEMRQRRVPSLSNRALFRRDMMICAYCGQQFRPSDLTRDHVMPASRGGQDVWTNVVTSCGSCNRLKSDKTPEEANMKLLYVPYAPSRSEWLILMNRNILANQMEFLLARTSHDSHLHNHQFIDTYGRQMYDIDDMVNDI